MASLSDLKILKVTELAGHQNPVFTVENGPEPAQLFTGGNDKGVVEWNMQTMQFVRVLIPVLSSVYVLYHIPESTLIAVGERSGLVSIVHTGTQKIVARLQHHQLPVFDIKAFKRKSELLVSSEDGTVSVWNMADDFKLLYHFKVADQTIRKIAVSRDEKVIAFGSKDGSLKLYHADDYGLLQHLPSHQSGITSLCFSPDGRYLLSGGRDAQLHVLSTVNYTLVRDFTPHMFAIYDIKYHPELPFFATGSRDKSIKLWSADDFRLLRIVSMEKGFDIHRLSINHITWNSYRNQLVSVSDDKKAMIWDITPFEELKIN